MLTSIWLYLALALALGLLIGYLAASLKTARYKQAAQQAQHTETQLAQALERVNAQDLQAQQLYADVRDTQAREQAWQQRFHQQQAPLATLTAAETQWGADRELWKAEREHLKRQKFELGNEISILKKEKHDALTLVARQETQMDVLKQQIASGQAHLQQTTEHLKTEFQAMAAEILQEKSKHFSIAQEKEMSTLLQPVRQQLQAFQQQVEKTYYEDTRERSSLRTELQQMMQLNQTLSDDARQLTQALKGNTKTQGDWGERILETLLEKCGLQKGLTFFVQETSRNEAGQTIRPDVVVELPQRRQIVIDSKVSLTHYELYCQAKTEADQKAMLAELNRSVRRHIEGLSSKGYTTDGRYEMTIMFMPLEAAYIAALQQDPDLASFALTRQVLFISSTNLLLTLRLIADMWRTDQADKNARLIAEKAGKLFEKLSNFVDSFELMGKKAEELQLLYYKANQQLRSGRGNALSKANELRTLGAKTNRPLLQADAVDDASEAETAAEDEA